MAGVREVGLGRADQRDGHIGGHRRAFRIRRTCRVCEAAEGTARRLEGKFQTVMLQLCILNFYFGIAPLALAVAVPTFAFIRSPGGFQNVDEARVFRMANMSEDEAPSMNDIGWHLRGNCGARWFEKRSFLDLFSRDRIIWVERPYCRHCGEEYSEYTECDSHGCDVFVRRAATVENSGVTIRTIVLRDISPRDSQRPATPEERERIMKRVKKDCR